MPKKRRMPAGTEVQVSHRYVAKQYRCLESSAIMAAPLAAISVEMGIEPNPNRTNIFHIFQRNEPNRTNPNCLTDRTRTEPNCQTEQNPNFMQ